MNDSISFTSLTKYLIKRRYLIKLFFFQLNVTNLRWGIMIGAQNEAVNLLVLEATFRAVHKGRPNKLAIAEGGHTCSRDHADHQRGWKKRKMDEKRTNTLLLSHSD